MAAEIKICGITEAQALDAALNAGVDYIGLVFFKNSPRNVDFVEAAGFARRAHGVAKVVALVVDPSEEDLAQITSNIRPDVLQFHGSETPEFIDRFRTRYVGEVWKAVPIGEADDIDNARPYLAPFIDRIVSDARPPAGATRPGGNGASFDWTLLRGLDLGKPYVLSGGLTPDNVADALRETNASIVDVSSGVESAPGLKDPDRIRAFVQAVRGVQPDQGKAVS